MPARPARPAREQARERGCKHRTREQPSRQQRWQIGENHGFKKPVRSKRQVRGAPQPRLFSCTQWEASFRGRCALIGPSGYMASEHQNAGGVRSASLLVRLLLNTVRADRGSYRSLTCLLCSTLACFRFELCSASICLPQQPAASGREKLLAATGGTRARSGWRLRPPASAMACSPSKQKAAGLVTTRLLVHDNPAAAHLRRVADPRCFGF